MTTDVKGSVAAGTLLGATTDRRKENQETRKQILGHHKDGKSLKEIYILTGVRPRRIRRIIGRLDDLE